MGKKGGPSSASGAKKDGKDGGKGKGGKSELKTCNHVKARHILCEKQGKINEVYKELKDNWLNEDKKVPAAKFGELASKYSECSSSKSGGNLGWFPRGKMVAAFEQKAFATSVGDVSEPFKTSNGWHIILVEGRKA